MKQNSDLILFNGHIQTMDENFTTAEAMAIKDGKIVGVGSSAYIFQHFQADQTQDLAGKWVFPGFIDSHSHFFGYALKMKTMADLSPARDAEEMVPILNDFQKEHPSVWIVGRGWDQNDWDQPVFPDKALLDKYFPDRPVVLIRIDGHAAVVNTEAMRRVGMTVNTIRKKEQALYRNGEFTGVFFEETADIFKAAIPPPDVQSMISYLEDAQADCFSLGLTTVTDAGLSVKRIHFLDSLQQQGILKIGLYVMLENAEPSYEFIKDKGIYQTSRLNVRSIKIYADGALGSRGACLLEPYSDDPSTKGIMVTPEKEIREICSMAYQHGFQVNTHCIGDSANSLLLKIYADFLKGHNDRRWRIEHAQVLQPFCLGNFSKYSIVPAIQTTHATSDMYWAGKRLGPERMKHAYAYKDLLKETGWVANGTDFPIEKINPAYTLYAAEARKDLKGWPEKGFQMENALSRDEALRSVTIWSAMGCMEDSYKGSLEVGKYADFILLNEDLRQIPIEQIPHIQILQTFVQGEKVFERPH